MRQNRDGAVVLIDRARSEDPSKQGLREAAAALRWRSMLVWYMRTLAWVWIAKGLFGWAIILGAHQSFGVFQRMPTTLQGTVVASACIDFLAAVGLWLAAPWGGVLWLLAAGAEAISPLFGARAAAIGPGGALINVALILIYLLVSLRAARERD